MNKRFFSIVLALALSLSFTTTAGASTVSDEIFPSNVCGEGSENSELVQAEDVSDQTLDVGRSTSADIEAESSEVSTSTEDQKQLSEIDQGTAESTETEQTDDPLRYSGSTYSLSV